MQVNKVKIVLTGKSGKTYLFVSNQKKEKQIWSILHSLENTLLGKNCAVYFIYDILTHNDTMEYSIISYGYTENITDLILNHSTSSLPYFIAYYKAEKKLCPFLIGDIFLNQNIILNTKQIMIH